MSFDHDHDHCAREQQKGTCEKCQRAGDLRHDRGDVDAGELASSREFAALGAYWQQKRKFSDKEIAAVKTMGQMIGKALAELI